jgi:hypothetical protein
MPFRYALPTGTSFLDAAGIHAVKRTCGRPGRPVNRRSPFFIGIAGTALATPRITAEVTTLVQQLPHYAKELQDHNSELGQLMRGPAGSEQMPC